MKKALYWFFGLLAVVLVAERFSGSPPAAAVKPVVAASSGAAAASVSDADVAKEEGSVQFEYTVDGFAKQLGLASSKLVGKDVRPPKIKVQKSDVADHFEVKVRPDVSVFGFLNNETRHMTKASITIGPENSGTKAAMLMGMLMMAVSPNSTPDERGAAFKSLMSHEPSAVVDNARYVLTVVDGATVLTATPFSGVAPAVEKPVEDAGVSGCEADLKCWAEKNWAEADAYCQEPVQKLGKYTSRWTDRALERKFDRYKWKDKQAGVITYAGDKIEFQNGFGAYQAHVYSCDFDTKAKAVLAVSAEPGRF